jgi:hypothetical protein
LKRECSDKTHGISEQKKKRRQRALEAQDGIKQTMKLQQLLAKFSNRRARAGTGRLSFEP